MVEIDEISLLVWLSRGNKKELVKALSKWTGCKEECYPDEHLIELMRKSIADISRKYHLRGLFFEYFYELKNWQTYASFYNKPFDESIVLGSTLFSIKPSDFDEEDRKTILELKQYYVEEKDESKKDL